MPSGKPFHPTSMSASCGHSHRKRRRRATPSAVDSPSNGSPMHETTPRRTNWVVPLYILWSAWLLRLDVTYGQETIPPQPGRTSNPALPPLTTPTQPSPVSSQPTVFSAPPSSPPTMLPTVSARPTVSAQPSNVPSLSHRPSAAPSIPPTKLSSTAPSEPPTLLPSNPPSFFPTVSPAPSQTPSNPPSQAPTTSPQPSATPSISLQPTVSSKPSTAPTISVPPTNEPSTTPSDIPSNMPSLSPSDAPSTFPTIPLSTFTQSFMSLIIVGIDQNLTVREIATWTTLTSEHVRQFWLGVRRSPVFVGEVTTRFVGQEPVDGGAIPRARQRRLQTLSPTVAPASGAMRIRYQQDIRYGIIVDFVDSLFDPLEETLFTAPFTFGQAEYNAALDTLRNSTDPLFVSDVMVGQPPTQPPSMRDNQGRTVIISTVVAVLLVVGAASAFIVYKIRKEDEQDTVGQFPSDDAGDEMFFHHTERLDSPDSYVETRPDADISQLTYPMHGTTRNTSSGSNASVLTFGEDSGPSGSGDGMPDTPTDAAPAAASSAPFAAHTLGGPFVKPASIARTASSEYAMAASLASQQGAPLKVIEDPDAMLPSNDGGTAVNQWPTETDDPDYPPHAFAGFQMQIQDLDDL